MKLVKCQHGDVMYMGGNYGFIREKIELKILILFIVRRLTEPISHDDLAGLAMCEEGISYFEFADCAADLVKNEHLLFEDEKYSLTSKGERNGEITENHLPPSVRTKAGSAASKFRAAQLRNTMIKTSHAAKAEGGYTVSLSMSDGVGEIFALELYATGVRQAQTLEKGFRKNAESVYNVLIEKILD